MNRPMAVEMNRPVVVVAADPDDAGTDVDGRPSLVHSYGALTLGNNALPPAVPQNVEISGTSVPKKAKDKVGDGGDGTKNQEGVAGPSGRSTPPIRDDNNLVMWLRAEVVMC
ncbi:hypothetical protein L1987_70079 [Smallanthus sonchifolius]|uniref:Uncharacterized protein n=1 Tax=Smallanthus sonchifolius TaxID=185202 RepID=A0ACB9API4_9ASTR|nr:hypothetical protein L1987_70079 [Smallanthus sonchifolius]